MSNMFADDRAPQRSGRHRQHYPSAAELLEEHRKTEAAQLANLAVSVEDALFSLRTSFHTPDAIKEGESTGNPQAILKEAIVAGAELTGHLGVTGENAKRDGHTSLTDFFADTSRRVKLAQVVEGVARLDASALPPGVPRSRTVVARGYLSQISSEYPAPQQESDSLHHQPQVMG